jgi:hypothetical protein
MRVPRVLTTEELAFFKANGFVGSFAVYFGEEMQRLRGEIEILLTTKGYADYWVHRHIDSRLVHDLCAHPAIVDRVASILGPDLLLWHTRFFDKSPGAEAIPWHQDAHFWPIEPDYCVTAWIAIDRADTSNACVEVIPGSHKRKIPHLPHGRPGRFGMRADSDFFDESSRVKIELEPGEFFLFDRWLLHSSPANNSSGRRLGLSARIVPPTVRVDIANMSPTFPELGVQIIRGSDTLGRNRLVHPPGARSSASSLR